MIEHDESNNISQSNLKVVLTSAWRDDRRCKPLRGLEVSISIAVDVLVVDMLHDTNEDLWEIRGHLCNCQADSFKCPYYQSKRSRTKTTYDNCIVYFKCEENGILSIEHPHHSTLDVWQCDWRSIKDVQLTYIRILGLCGKDHYYIYSQNQLAAVLHGILKFCELKLPAHVRCKSEFIYCPLRPFGWLVHSVKSLNRNDITGITGMFMKPVEWLLDSSRMWESWKRSLDIMELAYLVHEPKKLREIVPHTGPLIVDPCSIATATYMQLRELLIWEIALGIIILLVLTYNSTIKNLVDIYRPMDLLTRGLKQLAENLTNHPLGLKFHGVTQALLWKSIIYTFSNIWYECFITSWDQLASLTRSLMKIICLIALPGGLSCLMYLVIDIFTLGTLHLRFFYLIAEHSLFVFRAYSVFCMPFRSRHWTDGPHIGGETAIAAAGILTSVVCALGIGILFYILPSALMFYILIGLIAYLRDVTINLAFHLVTSLQIYVVQGHHTCIIPISEANIRYFPLKCKTKSIKFYFKDIINKLPKLQVSSDDMKTYSHFKGHYEDIKVKNDCSFDSVLLPLGVKLYIFRLT